MAYLIYGRVCHREGQKIEGMPPIVNIWGPLEPLLRISDLWLSCLGAI